MRLGCSEGGFGWGEGNLRHRYLDVAGLTLYSSFGPVAEYQNLMYACGVSKLSVTMYVVSEGEGKIGLGDSKTETAFDLHNATSVWRRYSYPHPDAAVRVPPIPLSAFWCSSGFGRMWRSRAVWDPRAPFDGPGPGLACAPVRDVREMDSLNGNRAGVFSENGTHLCFVNHTRLITLQLQLQFPQLRVSEEREQLTTFYTWA